LIVPAGKLAAGVACAALAACGTIEPPQYEAIPPRASPRLAEPRPPQLHADGSAIPALLRGGSTTATIGTRDIRKAYLGIAWTTLPGQGAVVTKFLERDTPAGRAGLRVGDVITAFNGTPTTSRGDLSAQLQTLAPGAAAILRITRNGVPGRLEIITDRR
jgi:S1-C subfamily serine protease